MNERNLSKTQISALSRLFSAAVFRELSRTGRSPLFTRLAILSGVLDSIPKTTKIKDIFDLAYSCLQKIDNRDEYVYKAAIANNILLGVHSLRTASILTEFRVGVSKADVVVLNGSTSVYEVKSERDRLDRLPSQIESYRKVFSRINIITAEKHLKSVKSMVSSETGLFLLTKKNEISTIRKAVDNYEEIDPAIIFDSLQEREAKKILQLAGIPLPNTTNVNMYKAMKKIFLNLSPEYAHRLMVKTLKETRSLLSIEDFVYSLPKSLRPVALYTKIRKSDQRSFIDVMELPFTTAENWL